MPVFRVFFSGSVLELSEKAKAALNAARAEWAGAEWAGGGGSTVTSQYRHHALVEAPSLRDAVATVRQALEPHGAFRDFDATQVSYVGRDGRPRPFRFPGRSVDWSLVRSEPQLTEVQRTVLENILDAAEPTWLILKDPQLNGDRQAVGAALGDLEKRGLVSSSWEWSGESAVAMDHWWLLTDAGWELLGLLKSPSYH